MAEQTTNLGLTKPDPAEGYNIGVFNANADILDGAVGALINEIGTTGSGGMSDKVTQTLNDVNTLQNGLTAARLEIAAVKTDTSALVQALATANANINTLLTQTKGVKTVVAGNVQVRDGDAAGTAIVNIPDTMNPERVVIITTSKSTALGDNVTWARNGRTVTFSATNYYTTITYQFIEFF
jgi:hypothetical protein